ncbi:MAG: hypothetical protein KJ060_21575, partial [Candidatus Hydrogenedentes bacterium]|nr:hypothetical protein [Candidatus Hydrogenedentota bacterium]
GPVQDALPANEAARQGNELLTALPEFDMVSAVIIDGVTYTVARGAPTPDAVVIQRLGRFLQHLEIRSLELRAADGSTPDDVEARLEIFAWPDRVSVALRVAGEGEISIGDLVLRYRSASLYTDTHETGDGDVVTHESANGDGLAFINPLPTAQTLDKENDWTRIRATGPSSVAVTLVPDSEDVRTAGVREAQQVRAFAESPGLAATGIAPYTGPLPVEYDPVIGWHRVVLGENPDINTMERVRLALTNQSDSTRTMRLCLAKEGGSYGITGMCPVLRDDRGFPLGLPVQISKNWHVRPPWFTGLTMLSLEPGAEQTIEFDLAYANWGNALSISHAQLSLEGWGTNQLWDQMAIGSFGESICYDPDVNLGRGMIDDMRPLMVWGMGPNPKKQWTWTHNVGGGDFLVLFKDGERQFLSRQKTLYERYGPVLTDVTYAGQTPDGAIQSVIRTQSWRSDDYVRAVYTIRYEVVAPVENIERLAFFQLGADHYNHNLFSRITTGNIQGDVDASEPETGGWTYSKRGVPLKGPQPWIALTGATKNPPPYVKEDDQGAWANRGLIVRDWKAVLSGQQVDTPHFSVFGTEDGNVSSAIVELSLPPGISALQAGDQVQAKIEMLILPQRADDYYGPNEPLREFLGHTPDTWHIVHREATLNNVKVCAQQGKVLQQFPVIVQAAKGGRSVEFTVFSGTGMVPITIVGAASRGPFTLVEQRDGESLPMDQSSHAGNDWWQTEYRPDTNTYDITFTVPMSGQGEPRKFLWKLTDDTD